MQERGGGLSVGSDLTGRGTERVRSLQFVVALGGLAAFDATTQMHVELAVNRLAGNLGLELFANFGLDDVALAMRAGVGEFRFVALVDLVGRRRRAMAVGAVLFARFAAGCFGLGFGRTFAEGRGLTLPGAKGLFELAAEFGVLGFESGVSLGEFAAPGARGSVPDLMLATRAAFSCASFATRDGVGGAKQVPGC